MADLYTGRKDYKSGTLEVDDRLFLIEFWEEEHFGLPWTRVSEIIVKPVKPHWFSRKTEMRNITQVIDSGWMACNRLDWAKHRISKFLQDEEDRVKESQQIDAFVTSSQKRSM